MVASLERQRAAATRMVFAGAALGSSAFYAIFTVAPLIAASLTGSSAWTGIPGACGVAGVGIGSSLLASVMARRGRRAGLRLGFAVGCVGTAIAGLAVQRGIFPLLLAAMLLAGIGHAANQLSRFAAADMYEPKRRPAALGTVVWAGTVGAILGPNLLKVAEPAAAALGLTPGLIGYAIGLIFFLAAAASSLLLRPDPSSLVTDTDAPAEGEPRSVVAMWRVPHARTALLSMVIGQVAMILLMTVTPVHVMHAGHGMGAVGIIMGAHFAGMFALAPLIGRLVARIGSPKTIVLGMAVLLLASGGAAWAPPESRPLLALFLFLLGLGWSLAFVAGSALLTRGLSYATRVRLQGGVDAVVWSASAVASLSSGFLLARFGFAALSLVGAGIAVAPIVWAAIVVMTRPRAAPVFAPQAQAMGAMSTTGPVHGPAPHGPPGYAPPGYGPPRYEPAAYQPAVGAPPPYEPALRSPPRHQPGHQEGQQPGDLGWPPPHDPARHQPALGPPFHEPASYQAAMASPRDRDDPRREAMASPPFREPASYQPAMPSPRPPGSNGGRSLRPSPLVPMPPEHVPAPPFYGDDDDERTALEAVPANGAAIGVAAAVRPVQLAPASRLVVELAQTLVAHGVADDHLQLLLDQVASSRIELASRAARSGELDSLRDALEQRVRSGPARLGAAIRAFRVELAEAQRGEWVDPEIRAQLDQLERRLTELSARAVRERGAAEERAIALAGELARYEERLANQLSELAHLVEQIAPHFRGVHAIDDVVARLGETRGRDLHGVA